MFFFLFTMYCLCMFTRLPSYRAMLLHVSTFLSRVGAVNDGALVVERQHKWTTGVWSSYPGSKSTYKGNAITGNLDLTAGDSENDLHIDGVLSGLPNGEASIHVHWGCDVNNAATVEGHYYDPERCADPWTRDVSHFIGPTHEFDIEIKGVPWIDTLGHVIVIHDTNGGRVAISRIMPMGSAETPPMPFGVGSSVRLPPHLALELWSPAVCHEDYSPAKTCSATPDSCGNSAAPTTTCRSETRHRWCDKHSSLVLKVTREIDSCAEVLVQILMHNPAFKQLQANTTVSGFGPGMTIIPTFALVDSGKAGVLASVVTPGFTHYSVSDSKCSTSNELYDSADLSVCGSPKNIIWLGSCAGMLNDVVLELTPNIDLDAGSLITISGLIRPGPSANSAPTLIEELSTFNHLGVQDWQSTTGTIVLGILQGDCVEPVAMKAGQKNSFKMQFEMPLEPGQTPSILSVQASLPASRPAVLTCTSSDGKDMCLLPSVRLDTAVFVTEESLSPSPSIVVRSISQATCLPGNCSRLTVAFSPNQNISDDYYLIISGLNGLHRCSSCLPSPEKCDPADSHSFLSSPSLSFLPLPLEDESGINATTNHRQLFQSVRDRNAEVSWHENSKSVIMKVAFGAHLVPYRTYSVSFVLKNGLAESEFTSGIDITAFDMSTSSCFRDPQQGFNTLTTAISTCAGEKMKLNHAACDGSSQTFKVCKPDIVTTIVQEHPWPGCGGPRSNTSLLHELSPFVESRAVEYTDDEKKSTCALEKKLCNVKNTITVTMTPNIEIPLGTNVTITHLQNAIDPVLQDEHDWIKSGSFKFDATTFQLSFELGSTWDSQDVKVLRFQLTNPAIAQESPTVSLQVQWTVTSACDAASTTVMINKAIETVPNHASRDFAGIYTVTRNHTYALLGAGDAAILKVQGPRWLIKVAGQSTQDPSEDNTISLTLAANVELRKGASITLTGLRGFATASSEHLNLMESSTLTKKVCHKIDSNNSESRDISPINDSTVLSATGNWSSEKGELVVTLEQTVGVKSIIEFSFILKNPCVAHSASISVQVEDEDFDCTIECTGCPGDSCTCTRSVQGNDCQLPGAATVSTILVNSPEFTFSAANQASCWPDHDNCATVAFRTNVKLENQSKIYVAGFQGASIFNRSEHSLVQQGVLQEWDVRRNFLTLSYINAVAANTHQEVKICFKNPTKAQRGAEISIWATNLCQCVQKIPKLVIAPAAEACDRVLTVVPPSFINPVIVQCHSYVGAMNIITATISTNVQLMRPRKVTVSGLVGSMTPDSTALPVYDGELGDCESGCSGSASKVFESGGSWTRDRGILVLHLREDVVITPGEAYLVQFQLENPPMEQQAPAVSISACHIGAVRMHSLGVPTQNHTCHSMKNSTDAPLHVQRPRIVDALIGQSTAAPGMMNEITVTLSVNSPVRPDPTEGVIIISGFNKAEAPCGALALFASDKSSHSAFMAAPDGVPGTGLWDCEGETLTLHVATQLQACDTKYVFSFRVTNPLCSQSCSPIQLRTQHLEFQMEGCGSSDECRRRTPAGLSEVILMASDTGTRCPMMVFGRQSPAIVYTSITQSSAPGM